MGASGGNKSADAHGRGRLRRVVLAGPTAVGKTSISLRIAKSDGFEIISADSRQCFRGLDIGTGKVTPQEAGGVPHWNISVMDPSEADTAAAFARRARSWEDEILRRGKTPLVVGGSTLHLQSLIWPLDDVPEVCVPNQIKLKELEKIHGPDHLLALLRKVDPVYATRMDGFNRQRTYRALDVYMQTGKPFSAFHSEQQLENVPEDTLLVVLTCERSELIRKINRRVDEMMAAGLIEEIRQLLVSGYNGSEQAFQTVGYKEVIGYLRGVEDYKSGHKSVSSDDTDDSDSPVSPDNPANPGRLAEPGSPDSPHGPDIPESSGFSIRSGPAAASKSETLDQAAPTAGSSDAFGSKSDSENGPSVPKTPFGTSEPPDSTDSADLNKSTDFTKSTESSAKLSINFRQSEDSAAIEKLTDEIKMSTRKYAKRQATWFRRWKGAHFLDISGMGAEEAAQQVEKLIGERL